MQEVEVTAPGRFPLQKLVIGVILVAIGVLTFVDAADLWHPHELWRLWPLGLIVLGLSTEADALMARRPGSGSILIGIGVWIFVGTRHLFGLSPRTSFPLGLAVVGLFMVLHALVDKPESRREENGHESR